jgi:hypothetical protein
MKNHLLLRLAAALYFVALFCFPTYAAEINNPQFSAKVKVSVSAPDDIKDLVSSYLNRELRSLNDVEIVDNNPDWEIEIVAMELKTVSGYKNGIAISTVILSPYNNQALSEFFKPEFKESGLLITSGLSWYSDQMLNVDSSDNLQELCKTIVADFDSRELEPSRKFFRNLKETRQKSKKGEQEN